MVGFKRPSIFNQNWQILADEPSGESSADLNRQPSTSLSIDDYYKQHQPDALGSYQHVRSQSHITQFAPLRTKTETRIWIDQHSKPAVLEVELEQGDRGSIISHTSSADYEDNKSGLGPWDEASRNDERERMMPFLVRPIHTNGLSGIKEEGQGEGGNGYTRTVTHEWLRAEDQASEWLSFFYDLVVVAVLTVFSSTHELSSPSAIWIFLSYFTILAWLWTSQVHYDIRYQAEDVFHRCCKVFQIIVLVYMGAASGSWNPGMMMPLDDGHRHSRVHTKREAAEESFETILIAFACSRVIFAAQYLTMAWLGYRSNRRIRGHMWTIASLMISGSIAIVAIKLPSTTSTMAIGKVCLFYAGLAIEGSAVWLQVLFSHHLHADSTRIGQRYGAFSLIILGEGFIALVRGFSKAITGLSVGSTGTYLQVFLAISIICLLWIFMFSAFRPETGTSQRRLLLWETVHFPLHYCLLLLLAAIVNVVIVLSFVNGIDIVAQEFVATIEAISNHTALSPADELAVENYLNRLPLAPSYDREFTLLSQLAGQDLPKVDPLISAYQYFAQIVVETTVSYGIAVGEETLDHLEQIYAINTTVSYDPVEQASRVEAARLLMVDIVEIPVDESMSGTLWLFPCAGGVLILIALRSMAWNSRPTKVTYATYTLQIAAGIGLGLMGLLDIGSKRVTLDGSDGLNHHLNPLYVLLQAKLPLVVVLAVYGAVYGAVFIGVTIMGRLLGRRGGRR